MRKSVRSFSLLMMAVVLLTSCETKEEKQMKDVASTLNASLKSAVFNASEYGLIADTLIFADNKFEIKFKGDMLD